MMQFVVQVLLPWAEIFPFHNLSWLWERQCCGRATSSGVSVAVGLQSPVGIQTSLQSPGAHARELGSILGICERLPLCSSPVAPSLAVNGLSRNSTLAKGWSTETLTMNGCPIASLDYTLTEDFCCSAFTIGSSAPGWDRAQWRQRCD